MTLEEFKKMNIEKQLLYDFTDDHKNKNYKRIKNKVAKFLVYKTVRGTTDALVKLSKRRLWNIKYRGLIDSDSESPLLQEIYKKLWSKYDNANYMKNDNGNICGDTMTSAITPLCSFLNTTDKYKKYLMKDKNQSNWTTYTSSKYYKYLMKQITFEKEKNIYDFIVLNHTLGNFIPVPKGFNPARCGSGNNANDDYWFLTLKRIEEYFKNPTTENLKILLPKKIYHHMIGNTKQWLNEYHLNFEKYLSDNYLQDYKDFIGYNKNNSDFIKKVNEVILLRTLRMLIKINDDKDKIDECKKLIELIQKDGYEKALEGLNK